MLVSNLIKSKTGLLHFVPRFCAPFVNFKCTLETHLFKTYSSSYLRCFRKLLLSKLYINR